MLDTNVLVRATPGRESPAFELLQTVMRPPHTLVLSWFLLDEVARALRYERVRQIHGLSDQAIQHYVQQFHDDAVVVDVPKVVESIVQHDPADDPVIATAIAGNAAVICTLDRHLRHKDVQSYCSRIGIKIMTDVELLRVLEHGSSSHRAD